jgi:hypothetical protein
MNPAEHTEHTNRVPLTGIPASSLGVPPMSGPSVPEYQRPLEAHPREEVYSHPFAVFAWYDDDEDKTWMQADDGAFTANGYTTDGESSDLASTNRDWRVRLGSSVGDFLGIGPTHPKLQLAKNSVYGVWVVGFLNASRASGTAGQWGLVNLVGDPVLLLSTTATTLGDGNSITGGGSFYHSWFIGRIEVSSSGVPEVTQHRRSDIDHQGCAWFEPEPPEEEEEE